MAKVILSLMLLNSIVFASTEAISKSEEVSQIVNSSHYEPNYFTMILGLFFVIALIYITGFLYQKLTKVNLKYENLYVNKPQIISTTSIGQGRNLHVVKIGDDCCLIGSTQNSITYLKDVKLQEDGDGKNS
ncbi:MAG: FliO/MopB family protein [Candidatus Gastranaerophilales bacterium]|nr:FliO/MopB family protein [Candidatus Gastranaerophilales bacterium]